MVKAAAASQESFFEAQNQEAVRCQVLLAGACCVLHSAACCRICSWVSRMEITISELVTFWRHGHVDGGCKSVCSRRYYACCCAARFHLTTYRAGPEPFKWLARWLASLVAVAESWRDYCGGAWIVRSALLFIHDRESIGLEWRFAQKWTAQCKRRYHRTPYGAPGEWRVVVEARCGRDAAMKIYAMTMNVCHFQRDDQLTINWIQTLHLIFNRLCSLHMSMCRYLLNWINLKLTAYVVISQMHIFS